MTTSKGPALIVDDEESIRYALKRDLEQIGFEPLAVSNVQEAVQAVERQKSFSLAVLDVRMPGMNGLELLRILRPMLPDACMALDYMLDLFAGVIRDLHVFPDRMRHNMESTKGVLFSQRVLLALVQKGVSREAAYETVHRNSMQSWNEGSDFGELLSLDPDVTAHVDASAIEDLFSYAYSVRTLQREFDSNFSSGLGDGIPGSQKIRLQVRQLHLESQDIVVGGQSRTV